MEGSKQPSTATERHLEEEATWVFCCLLVVSRSHDFARQQVTRSLLSHTTAANDVVLDPQVGPSLYHSVPICPCTAIRPGTAWEPLRTLTRVCGAFAVRLTAQGRCCSVDLTPLGGRTRLTGFCSACRRAPVRNPIAGCRNQRQLDAYIRQPTCEACVVGVSVDILVKC